MMKRLRIHELELVASIHDLCGFFVDELIYSKDSARSLLARPECNCVVLVLGSGWQESFDRDGIGLD